MQSILCRLSALCFAALTTVSLWAQSPLPVEQIFARPPYHLHPLHPFITAGPMGYSVAQIRHAYGFDQLSQTGAGQTIVLVEAFGSPTLQNDLDAFCAEYSLPATTVAVYDPQGMPAGDTGWALETSLDAEWAHAIAPGANLDVVVAKSASIADLLAAVDYAVTLGAKQISLSWGVGEFLGETEYDFHFNVPNVSFVVSAGDSGSIVEWPSVSPYVVSVGGTTLNLDASGDVISETGWSGSGGGFSRLEAEPDFQLNFLPNAAERCVPDISYDADPSTGFPVYISNYNGATGWITVGGTSAGAPQWTALFAQANAAGSTSLDSANNTLYHAAAVQYSRYFRDIVTGNNGSAAGPGWDFVTGIGSPLAGPLVTGLAAGTVADPTFTPPQGTYQVPPFGTIMVSLATATTGATIRYTTDDTDPTTTTGTLYTGPITVGNNPPYYQTAIRAIAFKNDWINSSVARAVENVFPPQVVTPVFSPPGGTYFTPQTVTMSSTTANATIRYTTDGSQPTPSSTLYTDPITLSSTTTLIAAAYKDGYIDTAPTEATVYDFPPASDAFAEEAESLSPTGSGATVSTATDANASGGKIVFLNANSVGATLTLTSPRLPAGTYQVSFRYKTFTNRGQHNVTIDGTQIGGTIDQYSASASYPTATLGNVTFETESTHAIKLKVTGKNSASSGYVLSADDFSFLPQSPLVLEAALMSPKGSGATISINTESQATGGKVVVLNAKSVGDSLTLTTPSLPAGTYQVAFRYKANNNRGTNDVVIDGTQLLSSDGLGDPKLDYQYSPSVFYETDSWGTMTFSSTGTHTIKLTSRYEGTSGFTLSADSFSFTPQ